MNQKRMRQLRCKLMSLCMVMMMVFSFIPTGIVHAETESTETKLYEVKINVAPKEADVTFYKGSDASSTPLGEGQVTDNGIVGDYHQYVLNVPEGRYCYRGLEGETNLGGMTIDIPFEEEVLYDPETGGGKPSGKGLVLTLRRINYYTNDEKIKEIGDYTLHAVPAGMPEVVCGDQYLDSSNRVVTPTMITARGNALVYTVNYDINNKELREKYAIPQSPNDTFAETASAGSNVFTLSKAVLHTIVAPKEAKAQVFKQVNNFNVAEIPAKNVVENEDGTVTSEFITPGGGNLTYRVSMEGKVTRAGYFGLDAETVTIQYDENEDPKSTSNSSYAATAKRMESSTLVNVNGQNNLNLGVDETFRLRGYRAAWQIINTDTQNIMIEPDFNYEIISGGEHIEMTPVTGQCTGNAGVGEQANWWDIKGKSEGTAVIEISYDAIIIGGEGTSFHGHFGATNPQRKSLVVIQVGKEENTLKMYPEGTDVLWDTEYDTVYFVEDAGSMTFTATLGEDTADKVELSTDKGATWKDVAFADGKYTAEGLVPGNNILKFTKGDHVEYQVVRGAKITYTITNKTHDFEGVYAVGDVLEIKYQGIFIPIPKISGIYNPGYGETHWITYTNADGVKQESFGRQYAFINDHYLRVTLEEAGDIVLSNGKLGSMVLGDVYYAGQHRELTDSGCGVNFSATGADFDNSILPTIRLAVEGKEPIPVNIQTNADNLEFSFTSSGGETYNFKSGEPVSLVFGRYSYKVVAPGYIRQEGTLDISPADKRADLNIQMQTTSDTTWDGLSSEEAPIIDGVYQISTANQLVWFANQVNEGTGTNWNAKLLEDISLGYKNPWTPINGYAGTFDGNGHFINDLYIASGDSNQALFGKTADGAVIKNLGVAGNVTVTGKNSINTAGIVAEAVTGTTIENCVNAATVTGTKIVGGIVGRLWGKTTVENCYNRGTIRAGHNAGGVIGQIAFASGEKKLISVKTCYNAGNVSCVYSGIGAVTYGDYAYLVKKSYYLDESCSNTALVAGTKVTATELKALAPTLGDAYLTGVEEYNGGYPVLTWEEGRILPYVVKHVLEEMGAYKDLADYRDAEKAELEATIESVKAAIAKATSVSEIDKIVADAKAVMDLIKTDAQLKAEEANKPADTPTQTPTDKPEEQPTEKPVETPTVPTELTAPANVKAANVAKSGKVKVTWKKVEGAAKYQVYRATKKNGKYTLVKTVATTSYTDSSATVGKSFYFKVKAVSADKNVKASAFSKAVKGTVVLKAPVVTAKSKTKKQVKLTWKKVSGAKKYEVYRAASKNGKYKKIATTTKLSYTNKKLKSGKTYYYKVKAIGKKKAYNSAFSTVKKCKVK